MIEYENLRKANEKFFEEYEKEFSSVLKSGWYILGDKVKTFEKEFANYVGSKFCIGVASGLDALTISIYSLNLPSGSEIIVASNTYIATILAILKCGHFPVLAEPDIRTYNINPDEIEYKISEKTRVILVTHLYGRSCDMDKILDICEKYNLILIEDCAQAHGALYKGKKVGSFGIGCFSFYPTKNLGCLGDGGAITISDENLYEKILALRNYGFSRKYYADYVGFNSRLDEIQAAFLLVKLKYLDKINEHKNMLAKIYLENLDERFIKPVCNEEYYSVYHIFNIRHKKRDSLKEYLAKNGVLTEIHYPVPPHKQKAMKGILKGAYPISEEIHNTTLSLPISFYHKPDEILKVCQLINSFS